MFVPYRTIIGVNYHFDFHLKTIFVAKVGLFVIITGSIVGLIDNFLKYNAHYCLRVALVTQISHFGALFASIRSIGLNNFTFLSVNVYFIP